MQRGTRLPGARVLARRPHALAAPLLAAALVMAQGGQSPGTTSASVQVSPGSHDRGVFPGGPQVQRLGSRSPTGHFTRLARRFSPFVMLEFPVRRAVSERGGGLLRCTGSRECSLGCLTINSVRACCHTRTHVMARAHIPRRVSPGLPAVLSAAVSWGPWGTRPVVFPVFVRVSPTGISRPGPMFRLGRPRGSHYDHRTHFSRRPREL